MNTLHARFESNVEAMIHMYGIWDTPIVYSITLLKNNKQKTVHLGRHFHIWTDYSEEFYFWGLVFSQLINYLKYFFKRTGTVFCCVL